MKAIKETIYKSMTPQQRVIASMEAIARGDEDERSRLSQTCPKFHYTMTDHHYCERLEALRDLALAVEHDIRGCILAFFYDELFYKTISGNDLKSLIMNIELSSERAEDVLGIIKAWHEFLIGEGIDPAVAESAFADMRDDMTKKFIQIAEKLELEPDKHTARQFGQWLRHYYERV
jgi:hypothetical protein